jgi:hypothetical protein
MAYFCRGFLSSIDICAELDELILMGNWTLAKFSL